MEAQPSSLKRSLVSSAISNTHSKRRKTNTGSALASEHSVDAGSASSELEWLISGFISDLVFRQQYSELNV
jgi:hypothetical protein